MDKKLEYFIQQKQLEENEQIQKEKRTLLLSLGLYNKAFSPNNVKSSEFPYEWHEMGQTKYYKAVPINISDAEYEILKKYAPANARTNSHIIQSNTISVLFNVVAWIIFVVGFFAGIAIGDNSSFALTFIFWCAAFISGLSFLGIAEIIKLLNSINNKIK